MGGTITANQAHEPDKPSYRAELSTLSKGGAEALAIFAYYGSSGIAIIRNSLENGLFGKFYAADGMFDESVIEQIGADNLRGNIAITQSASDDEDASYKIFAADYSAGGGNPKVKPSEDKQKKVVEPPKPKEAEKKVVRKKPEPPKPKPIVKPPPKPKPTRTRPSVCLYAPAPQLEDDSLK